MTNRCRSKPKGKFQSVWVAAGLSLCIGVGLAPEITAGAEPYDSAAGFYRSFVAVSLVLASVALIVACGATTLLSWLVFRGTRVAKKPTPWLLTGSFAFAVTASLLASICRASALFEDPHTEMTGGYTKPALGWLVYWGESSAYSIVPLAIVVALYVALIWSHFPADTRLLEELPK